MDEAYLLAATRYVERMRRGETTGRPLGDAGFVRRVGTLLGGDLVPKKPGRKAKTASSERVRDEKQILCPVRRDKAAIFRGSQSHPATVAPAGSNRSSGGGDKIAGVFGVEASKGGWRASRP
jgi:hypothetical protein